MPLEEDSVFGYSPKKVLDKYRNNNKRGLNLFLAGKGIILPEQENWPGGWKEDANAAILWTPASEREIRERILDPLEYAAEQAGIKLWLPTIHSTLLSGDLIKALPEGTFDGARCEKFNEIARSDAMVELVKNFPVVTASFGFVVMDGGNVTLNCVEIPASIARGRAEATAIFDQAAACPKNMDEILHVTGARLRRIPKKITRHEFAQFAATIHVIAQDVARDPIVLTSERLWFGRDIQPTPRDQL